MEDNAVSRYSLFINIAKLIQMVEVFFAVVLISWSSTRITSVLKLSGEHLLAFSSDLLAFSSNLLNQHVVFFVGNVIIVLCYVLSRHTESRNDSEIHEETFSLSFQRKTAEETPIVELCPIKETEVVKEMITEDKGNQRARYENAIVKAESDMAVETAIKQAAKQIEWFSRTQSAKLKREISLRPQQEVRRSATATARRSNMLVTSFNGSSTAAMSFETVDKLSNEEFQVAVETFISKHQSFLKQQSMAEKGIKI